MKTNLLLNPLAVAGGLMMLSAGFAPALDWPQWRGPQRNGLSKETGLLKEWPKEGPKLLWEAKDLGRGYSTPAVVGDRIYVLGSEGVESEFVEALNVKDGKREWSTRLGKVGNPNQQPNFPAARSTPTVDGDELYALSSDGDLACLELAGGKVRWQKSVRADFEGKPGTWAYAESPLVDGDVLVCAPGGGNATVVALNKKTGEVIWKMALPEGSEATYASANVIEVGGTKEYVEFLQKGLVGVEAKTGKLLWRYEKTSKGSPAVIPTPMARDGFIYSAGARCGGGLIKLKAAEGKIEPEQIYFSPKYPAGIGGVLLIGDYLYGTTAAGLACLDFATGNVKWEERALGAASLCSAEGLLYLHGENGEAALVEATPDGYREKGRFTPPDQPKKANAMEKAWAYPVVANGRLYLRDHDLLWCYDVKSAN